MRAKDDDLSASPLLFYEMSSQEHHNHHHESGVTSTFAVPLGPACGAIPLDAVNTYILYTVLAPL